MASCLSIYVRIAHGVCDIETEDEERDVQPDADTCIKSELFVEGVESEFAVGHGFVGMISPNVTRIDEYGAINDVVKWEAEFGIELQL